MFPLLLQMFPQVIHRTPVGLDQIHDLGQTIHMTNSHPGSTSPASPKVPSSAPSPVGEKLFAVALTRIREKGFEGVTVSEVTREAGVAKGTFFNYFRSKDHILSEYLIRTVERILREVENRGHSGTDAILALSDTIVDSLLADPKVAEALIARLGSLPASRAGAPSGMHILQDWIQAKLGETLPVRVPLVDPPHPTSLPAHLTWALRGKLEEWAQSGQQGGKSLKKTVRRELGFILASAGLPSD